MSLICIFVLLILEFKYSQHIFAKSNFNNKENIVVIDPGHGGYDSGSIGVKKTQEKNITLSVSLKLGRILEANGIKVVYTHSNDKITWSMNERSNLLSRSKISNDSLADIFISIHTNSIKLNNIRGIETYYYPGSTKGKLLASLIQKELIKDTKLNNRGIRSEDFLVLQNVKATAVLVELGYISNVYEEAILSNTAYQDKFAQAMARAILSYFRK